MSSLWTPGGEHPVDRDRPQTGAGGPDQPPVSGARPGAPPRAEELSPEDQARAEALAAEMAEARKQLASVPAAVVVANHAMGLYELAAIHLGSQPPKLDEARVAIDAFSALLDAVADRLGEDGTTLRDALAQLKLAYVQLSGAQSSGEGQEGQPASAPGDGA